MKSIIGLQKITVIKSFASNPALDWYSKWLEKKFGALPSSLSARFLSPSAIFDEVARSAIDGNSIEAIATHLLSKDLIKSVEVEDTRFIARFIAFAVVGWQTMLYEPAFDTCPPSQLVIADLLDGYMGQAFMTLKQDGSRARRHLPDFLLGFGLMLPKENLCLSPDMDECKAFEKLSVIMPDEFNAALLQPLAKIKVKWVDVIAPHLEFDKATNTLFLFRYPSFCLGNIASKGTGSDQSVLYSCGAQNSESTQWASKSDISQLLQEILLSYRLLFGQTNISRQLYPSTRTFCDDPCELHDQLLKRLCTEKVSPLVMIPDRPFYRLSRDFPVLRSRIATLQYQMSNLKPRGWKEIWQDRRDSAQWLTFWAVIVIGGSGIILSLIQVILQAAQLGNTH